MNISKLVAPLLLGALLLPVAANAQSIRERRMEQRERINQGVHNGTLTRREARHLRHREMKTNRMIRRDRRFGGSLSPMERMRIERRLNSNSRAIYRQKHDRQVR